MLMDQIVKEIFIYVCFFVVTIHMSAIFIEAVYVATKGSNSKEKFTLTMKKVKSMTFIPAVISLAVAVALKYFF